jgi:hypothetical protein
MPGSFRRLAGFLSVTSDYLQLVTGNANHADWLTLRRGAYLEHWDHQLRILLSPVIQQIDGLIVSQITFLHWDCFTMDPEYSRGNSISKRLHWSVHNIAAIRSSV